MIKRKEVCSTQRVDVGGGKEDGKAFEHQENKHQLLVVFNFSFLAKGSRKKRFQANSIYVSRVREKATAE